MKYIKLLLFLAAVSLIESSLPGFSTKICTDYQYKQTEEHQAYNKNFCRALKVTDSYDKCCYMKYEMDGKDYYNCAPLTLNDYYDIKTKISSLKSAHGIDIKKLYCNSSYVYASLFLILIFLL